LGIAGWGAATGTLSLGLQWWQARARFREPLLVSGNVDTTECTLTFTIPNRDPKLAARIERIDQRRRRNWLSTAWYEIATDAVTLGALRIHSPSRSHRGRLKRS
jgi:hypothetical protein